MTEPVTPPIPERPLLHGERVWLRPMEERDLPAYVAGINDTEVGGWAGYRMPFSLEQANAWHTHNLEQSRSGEAFFFAVCEMGDDRFIGTIWFKEINRLDLNAELAIYMDHDHLGAGWGSDAQRTLLAFGFGTLGLERIWLTVMADNARAIRSYEKVGFRREGVMRRSFRVRGTLTDSLIMAILRDEWEAGPKG
ncbi:MAG: GNAT family protein [Chloroflexota bacterium]